jgi:hypothetical protein
VEVYDSEISGNVKESIYVFTPFRELNQFNISEITFMINRTKFLDNGRGIYQYSKDLRDSNNLYHWVLRENLFERNTGGGLDVALPYVWQYNENYTHTVHIDSNHFANNNDFVLEIWDMNGDRYATARTRLIPSVSISTFSTTFNADTVAYCTIGCQDNLTTADYYRITLHKASLFKKDDASIFKYIANKPYVDELIYDAPLFEGKEVLQSSDYNFFRTDTIIGTVYHINKAYYDYLQTSRTAIESNFNPFVEPTTVISNIEGGNGIFTFLSYDRDTLYIPWFE